MFILLLTGSYFAIQNSRVQTYLTQVFANQISKQINSKITIGKVNIAFFNKIVLDDVLIEGQKNDTLFYTQQISAKIDSLKIKAKKISIDQLSLDNNNINIARDSANRFNFSHIIEAFKTNKDTTNFWQIKCNQFGFNNSNISYSDLYTQEKKSYFLNNFNFDVSEFQLLHDSVLFKINDLNLNDNNNLFLNHLSANISILKDKIDIQDFNFETNNSEIKTTELTLNFGDNNPRSLSEMDINIRFSDSEISFYEIAELVPALKGMNQKVKISGQVYGNINDLKGRNLVLETGQNSSATLDFYINDLIDVKNMYLFLDLKQSQTTFNDLSQIQLPVNSPVRYLVFPESFYETGEISYKGNFSGFLTDFVTFGTFTSDMGILTTDVSVIPEPGGAVQYQGKLSTNNFELGELFKYENIGSITFNGNVDGKFFKNNNTFLGKFNGNIAKIEVLQYVYQNINLDGTLDNKMFDGMLNINDPNLEFDFTGQVNLNPEIPVFDFKLQLDKMLPGNLNLSKHFPASEMAFNLAANFTGNKLDNLEGSIVLQDGFYENKNGKFHMNGMELNSIQSDSKNLLTFNSDYFDIEIDGEYHFQSILNAFQKSANFYLPATSYEKLANAKDNIFDYQINVKNIDTLTSVFIPKYKVETPFLLYGKLDSENADFSLEGSIPGVGTNNFQLRNIFIGNKPKGDEYTSKIRVGEILLKNGMSLYNLSVDSKIFENVIDNQISWTNYDDLTYSGILKSRSVFSKSDSLSNPQVEIEGFPTQIFIADSVWQISPFTALVDTNSIEINNFKFYNNNQQITIDGKISEDKSDILSAKFENINLSHLETYFNKDLNISGILNGSAGIFDFYGQQMILSDLGINNLEFKNQKIGNIVLTNYWDNIESALNSELSIINNERKSLFANGSFQPTTNELNYDLELNNLSLVFLETLMRKNFSNIHGNASGNVKIHGQPDNILIDGALFASNAGLTIDYTQVSYFLNDSIYFKGNTLLFDQIKIQDINNNEGIFNGTIAHQNFKEMDYNLNINSPKILAINTQPKDNEQFFGQVIASGNFNITGHGKSVNLSGTGTTLPETDVNISLDYESEIKQYDFIQFVSTEKSENQEFLFQNKKNEGDFSLNLTIRVTPDAKAQLIYNSQIGDVIKAQGDGILLFGMDKEGNITLSGNYTVEKGDYLFTLQNVINKRFSIEQGGSIIWSGDPYNAIIDLNAVYDLKASLYDLLLNSYEVYQSQRIPIECKILLSEELSNPTIQFEIDFPTAEERDIDELQQYFNTEEEMNKQILSLLVMGKFYTPEYMRGTYEAQNPNIIGTTASELFSNQLSNWLSQISNLVDVGFNYRPGNQMTNDEIELALSTQMFNDRVTLNGNIGNNANPNSTNNSQLVGDFDINVKLNPSGKIQFKAYNRSNNNLIYETAPYTQGVGFSFQEEYNSFNELLKKMGALFRKRERN